MREVLLLVGESGEVLWSDVSDSPVLLPDSRERWEAIWSRRDRLVEIAHSHPVGPRAFSSEDRSTMEALDAALGRPLVYTVVAPDGVVRRTAEGRHLGLDEDAVPWWAALLRLASGMSPSPRHERDDQEP